MSHEKILLELKEVIASQGKILKFPAANEELRRRCCTLILKAAHASLISWKNSFTNTTLASGLIRQLFSLLLTELGPGDDQVRAWVVSILPSLESTEGRQLLLDALPWFMAIEPGKKEEASETILVTFRKILLKDPKALLPIIGCLSNLSLSEHGQVEAWNLALASLPIVDEVDLPALVQSLLRNVTDAINATKALQALREEIHLIDCSNETVGKEQMPIMCLTLSNALADRTSGSLIFEAYAGILEQVTRHQIRNELKPYPKSQHDTHTSFTIVDMMVILEMYHHPIYKARIEKCIDELLCAERFPFQYLETFLTLTLHGDKRGMPTSLLQNRLLPPLQAFALFLILAQARVSHISVSVLDETQNMILWIHRRLDRDRQDEFVRWLLTLSDESSQILSHGNFGQVKKVRRGDETQQKQRSLIATIETIHHIVMDLGRTSPSALSKFKYQLMERLTTEREVTMLAVQQVSQLLATLVEAPQVSQSGIDSTELMILLQKLLFTSSFRQTTNLSGNDDGNNAVRIVRGVILANQLVKSSSMSTIDKGCMLQWIQQLILPSNRRTVFPMLGRQGLHFLMAWKHLHDSQASHSSVFNTVRMVMANTGLVQLLSNYTQVATDRRTCKLVYNELPAHFIALASNGHPVQKGKVRELVLCIDYFLRLRGTSSPQGWLVDVQWIFELVDCYLELGRNVRNNLPRDAPQGKSAGWTPDGWLKAAIELPSLPSLSEDSEAHLLFLEAFNFDLKGTERMVDKRVAIELTTAILNERGGCVPIFVLEDFIRFASGVAFASGLSIAILKNAHRHFDSVGITVTGLKLLHFQLMKILDLEEKALFLVFVLESMSDSLSRTVKMASPPDSGKRRRSETEGDVDVLDQRISRPVTVSRLLNREFYEMKDSVDSAVKALTTISEFLVHSSDNLFFQRILYESLSCSEDDEVLHRFLSHKTLTGEVKNSASMVIKSRLQILMHLSRNLRRKSQQLFLNTSEVDGGESFTPSDDTYARIMKTASRLSLTLPAFRREHYTDGLEPEFAQLASLVAAYLSVIREHFIQHQEQCLSHFEKYFTTGVDELAEGIVNSGVQKQIKNQAVQTLLFHIHSCDDQRSSTILVDILGLLALRDGSLVDQACDMCWRALHTVFTIQGEDQVDELPYTFLRATDALLCNEKRTHGSKRRKLAMHAILTSVVRISANSCKDCKDGSMTRNTLLLLWALMIQHNCSNGRAYSFLSKILNELDRFLLAIFSSANGKEGHGSKGGKYVHISSIPGLSHSSLGFFVDMVISITLATLASIPPAVEDTYKEESPFIHISVFFSIMGRLLDLYSKYSCLFPRKLAILYLNSCQIFLNLCQHHVERCVEWRNRQPMLTHLERKQRKHDRGAIKYLDNFLTQTAEGGVGRVASFCEWARTGWRKGRTGAVTGSVTENEEWIYAIHHKKISALLLSAEKAMVSLRSVASAHNLVPPKAGFESTLSQSIQQVTCETDGIDKGFHEISWESVCAASTNREIPNEKKRRVTPTLPEDQGNHLQVTKGQTRILDFNVNPIEELHSEGGGEQSTGDFSDGFGVSGDWGDAELSGSEDDSLALENTFHFAKIPR